MARPSNLEIAAELITRARQDWSATIDALGGDGDVPLKAARLAEAVRLLYGHLRAQAHAREPDPDLAEWHALLAVIDLIRLGGEYGLAPAEVWGLLDIDEERGLDLRSLEAALEDEG